MMNGHRDLPHPATARSKGRRWNSLGSGDFKYLLEHQSWLVQRARTTNLAVIILGGLAVLSLLINVRLWLGDEVFRPAVTSASVPLSIKSTLPPERSSLRHLVIVVGHAIWRGSDTSRLLTDEDWTLESYQRGGSVKTFVKHISKGAEVMQQDPRSLLVFSGGQTREDIQATEGDSYWRIAKDLGFYGEKASDAERGDGGSQARATTEQFALDSFQNLIFSIARFKEVTGHYPAFITVVGYGFKRRRFEEVHRAAIRWPSSQWEYIGIDDQGESGRSYEGERAYGLEPFLKDLYGCHGSLREKRLKRNPFRRFHPYHLSAFELRPLLDWCPDDGTEVFPGKLPWD